MDAQQLASWLPLGLFEGVNIVFSIYFKVSKKPQTFRNPTPRPCPVLIRDCTAQWSMFLPNEHLCFLFLFVCLFFVFRDRVSLCSPGCPGTHSVGQAVLELRNQPASASQVLGLKACATTLLLLSFFPHFLLGI